MMDLDMIIKSWEYCNEGIGCDPECPLIKNGEACIDVLHVDTLKYLKELKALKKHPAGSEQEPCLRELRALLQKNLDRDRDAELYVSTIVDWIDLKLNEYVDRDAEDAPKQSFKDQDIDRRNEEPDGLYYKHDETVKPVHIPFKVGDTLFSVSDSGIYAHTVVGYECIYDEKGLRAPTVLTIEINTYEKCYFNIENGYNNYLFPTFDKAKEKLMELRKEKEAK